MERTEHEAPRDEAVPPTGPLIAVNCFKRLLINRGLVLFQVIDGKLPMNHQITYHLQDIFNLLPDLADPEFVKSTNVNTNDQMLVVYTASLIRSIIALHNLINNKLSNKEAEKKESSATSSTTTGKKDESKDKNSKEDVKDKDKAKEEKK